MHLFGDGTGTRSSSRSTKNYILHITTLQWYHLLSSYSANTAAFSMILVEGLHDDDWL